MIIADYILLAGIVAIVVVALIGFYVGKGCGGDCNQGRRDCDCDEDDQRK